MNNKSKFLIAAVNSGAGKTTFTLGLLQAMCKRGLRVQPFKCGPDYIDTKLHAVASGNESVNLDLFMASDEHVESIFDKHSSLSDISIVEGVMGLFDGYSKMKGSAAEVAILLDIPIILIINAKASAYSVAALLYGFKNFNAKLNIAGAIFNNVGSESHYEFLKDACDDVGVAALGYLKTNPEFVIPSRHLGLDTDNNEDILKSINAVADALEQSVDIDQIISLTSYESKTPTGKVANHFSDEIKIGVARDEAFNFMYKENISALNNMGEVVFFSPIHDNKIPAVDFIYLPGGYPELYAQALSSNVSMRDSIREYVNKGGKLWAECGGMMYLMQELTTAENQTWPMVGIFDGKSSMLPMKLSLGYRYFNYKGVDFKGHEFHYSHTDFEDNSLVQQFGARDQEVKTKLVRFKNAIAGYTHIYWADSPNWMNIFNESK